jgi:hypothetical protein
MATEPVKERIEERLGCEGYFGFGGGWALAKGLFAESPRSSYCNECPQNEPCWFRHRGRVMFLLPVVTASFLDLAMQKQMEDPNAGPEIVKAWFEQHHMADPFSTVLAGNMEDGARVAAGESPKDRGAFTLPWPLAPRAL